MRSTRLDVARKMEAMAWAGNDRNDTGGEQKRRRSSGSSGCGVRARERPNLPAGRVLRDAVKLTGIRP